MHIVLHEPEIPQNTGNIARTCAVTGSTLHLVGPLGFSLEDRYLKRAGLDYWQYVDVRYWESFRELAAAYDKSVFYFLTTRGGRRYDTVTYGREDLLVFGSETRGLPAAILQANRDYCLRIPMGTGVRSLNLSNSVALVLYEALRQQGFPGLM